MTFLRAPEESVVGKQRSYVNWYGSGNYTNPVSGPWSWRFLQGDNRMVPETVTPGYLRCSQTLEWNRNTRFWVVKNDHQLGTDDQVMRSAIGSTVNGLLGGLLIKSDIGMQNGLFCLLCTDGNQAGLYRMIDGSWSSRLVGFTSASYSIGNYWALTCTGNVYKVFRSASADGQSGTQVCTWTDSSNTVKTGADYRRGGFLVNSDANAAGTKNYGNGWRDYDFFDVGYTAA